MLPLATFRVYKKTQVSVVALWGLLMAVGTVFGHEPARLEETLVLGKTADLLGLVPSASEGGISGEELRARPLLRRGEILESVPGMVVTQHSGGGKANQYFLRGFNLDHGTDFAVSLDGMPVNMRTHSHGQGYADLNILIPELVERVDYVKGTYAARNGDFSSAGSADFRFLDALPRGFATFGLGEYGFYRGASGHTFWMGDRPESGRLTVAGEYGYYDGPWKLAEQAQRGNGFARYYEGNEEDHFTWTLLGYRGSWRSTDQIPLRAVRDGRLGRFDFVDPTNGGESQRYSLQVHREKDDGNGKTWLNLYGIYYDLDLFSNFTYRLNDPVRGDQFEQAEQRAVLGGELARSCDRLSLLGYETELTSGLQVRSDWIHGIGLHATERRNVVSTIREDDVTQNSVGIFGEATTRWTPWMRTVTGIRADGFQFGVSSGTRGNSGTEFAGVVSPKFSLVLGPWQKTELYGNFGTGFHSNDARGVNTLRDPVSGSRVDPVDPVARTVGAEFGLRTSVVEDVTATVSFWWLESESELVYVGDAGTNEAGPGSSRSGVEASLYWKPKDWLRWDLEAALTRARLRDSPGADRIPNSVPWMLSGGFVLGAQGTDPGWFSAARVRAFGRRPLSEEGSVKGRPTCGINAEVGYRTDRWETALECVNLLDRRDRDIEYFYGSRLAGEPAGGFEDIHFHPVEPRMLRARFTYWW